MEVSPRGRTGSPAGGPYSNLRPAMRTFLPLSVLALLVGCLLALVALPEGPAPPAASSGTPASSAAIAAQRLTTPPASGARDPAAQRQRRTPVVQVVERLSPAVVNISAESIVREADPFFGGFFGS